MKLGNILETASEPVVYREITFQVLGQDANGKQVRAKATACLAFVSEDARAEALRQAAAHFKVGGELEAEESYWFILAALREKGNEAAPFCLNEDIAKFRSALILDQVKWIRREYQRFVKDEYPELATPEQQEDLQGQARKP